MIRILNFQQNFLFRSVCPTIFRFILKFLLITMSSNFPRLYRELCKKDVKLDSGKVYDPSYEREREEVFFDIGFEVGRSFPERIRYSIAQKHNFHMLLN